MPYFEVSGHIGLLSHGCHTLEQKHQIWSLCMLGMRGMRGIGCGEISRVADFESLMVGLEIEDGAH